MTNEPQEDLLIETEKAEARAASPLKMLFDTRQATQKFRIGVGNRIAAAKKGEDTSHPDIYEAYETILAAAEMWEKLLDKQMEKEVRRRYPVWDFWLKNVKGIGPGLASQMLALLLPPLEERGPSTWFKAAGMIPEDRDGVMRLPRARVGEGRITYHPGLRKCLYLVGSSFVRSGGEGFYRGYYDQRKRRLFEQHCWDAAAFLKQWESTGSLSRYRWLVSKGYDGAALATKLDCKVGDIKEEAAIPSYLRAVSFAGTSDDHWPLIRVDQVARWVTIRLFLCHLWEMWLKSEDKTWKRAYVLDIMGHNSYIAPPIAMGGAKV